jgi:hypothetical protein
MARLGEDVTEVLDYVPGHFQVIRHIRPKYACTACASAGDADPAWTRHAGYTRTSAGGDCLADPRIGEGKVSFDAPDPGVPAAPGGVVGLLGAVPGGPPRKRKAVPLTGPAIMRKGAPKPETTPASAKEDRKAAIVTATPKRRRSYSGSRVGRRTTCGRPRVPGAGRAMECDGGRNVRHRRAGSARVVTRRCIWRRRGWRPSAVRPDDRSPDPAPAWRSYGTDPLPTGAGGPRRAVRAFTSWDHLRPVREG